MLKYLVGIPVFGFLYYIVYITVTGLTIALGDTGEPPAPISIALSIPLLVLDFPFGYLGRIDPVVDWLKVRISDNGVIYLFGVLNAVVWGAAITWAVGFVRRRVKRPTA